MSCPIVRIASGTPDRHYCRGRPALMPANAEAGQFWGRSMQNPANAKAGQC